jgi:hypothetical protein
MRLAEPFKKGDYQSEEEKHEAERLMFLELTQGLSFTCPVVCVSLIDFSR